MRSLCLAVVALGALAGPSFADPALTTASSNMRKAANPHAPIVQQVPANAQIDIQSCGGDWCYGSWRGLYDSCPPSRSPSPDASGGRAHTSPGRLRPAAASRCGDHAPRRRAGLGRTLCRRRLGLRLAPLVSGARRCSRQTAG